jgi:hypothetical protein
MKNRPVGAELFHEDGQPDMTKPIVAFRNFAKARDGQPDMTKPIVAFRNFAKARDEYY